MPRNNRGHGSFGDPGLGGRARGSVVHWLWRSSIARLSATLKRSAFLRSADQRWRLVNEACIVHLLDKKVRHVAARDKAGAPVTRID
jgi:hypothetical protein